MEIGSRELFERNAIKVNAVRNVQFYERLNRSVQVCIHDAIVKSNEEEEKRNSLERRIR